MSTVCAIVCAAGRGNRAGFDKNKLLVPFDGSTALEKTLSVFDCSLIDEIVVTASELDFAEITQIAKSYARTRVVLGGQTRLHSVHGALKTVRSEIVLIHDGARPFVTRELVQSCIESVKQHGSGVCALPCTDTVAKVQGNRIAEVPDRKELFQLQTPQGFWTKEIASAYEKAINSGCTDFTDDSSVYRAFCGSPHTCLGARGNYKLTYAEDFAYPARVGFGVDTHAFGKAQDHIVLGGVKIPSESGLVAHSDGDVLIHALMDAMLSAAGLKDIGHYFPDTEEKWKGASSVKMLELVHGMLKEQNLRVQNVSIAVQAERPRLAKYMDEMKATLACVLELKTDKIGITAGTNEGLGYVGEGKGITVYATVLLQSPLAV